MVRTQTPDRQLAKGTTTLLVLSLLSERPMHGYRLVRELAERCEGHLAFKEGTVYPLLYGLEDEGHIVGQWAKGDSGRRLKLYRVTPEGELYRQRRLQGWRSLVKAMNLVVEPV